LGSAPTASSRSRTRRATGTSRLRASGRKLTTMACSEGRSGQRLRVRSPIWCVAKDCTPSLSARRSVRPRTHDTDHRSRRVSHSQSACRRSKSGSLAKFVAITFADASMQKR
jgi:hypothetical protein